MQFYYDPLNRRVAKVVTDNLNTSLSYARQFEYDGEDITTERNAIGGSVLAMYTHSKLAPDDVLASYYTSSAVSAGIVSASFAGKSISFLKDAIGSVTDLIDSTGNIVQRYDYSSFGKILKISDAGGVDVTSSPQVKSRYTYTGREFDDETELYYYRARYYDASVGRFLQVDPHPGKLSSPQTVINKYSYSANRPTLFRDSDGKFPILAIFMLIGAAAGAIDASMHGENILAGAFNGALLSLALCLTYQFTAPTTLFGAIAPSLEISYFLVLAPTIFSAASTGGSFYTNFSNKVLRGDTMISAAFTQFGYAFDSLNASTSSISDLIEIRSAQMFSYILIYGYSFADYNSNR